MKPFWKDLIYACMMGLILPWMMLSAGLSMFGKTAREPEPTVAKIHQYASENLVPVLHGEKIEQWALEEYLVGVVLAEMPASFEEEALKAQSVVARTYAMRACRGVSKHENAALCTNSACCQSYISELEYLEKGGKSDSVEKVRNAVLSTAGYVLTYEGELIEATYFSCSGGRTEDAVAVWGTEVPYLRSVDSPGEEKATYYTDSVTFTAEEFCEKMGMDETGDPRQWFGEIIYTAGGGVKSMEVCGKVYSGTELRTLLGLRSTAFSVEVDMDSITFESRGYGHRVGMSQYGADAMAATGRDYAQILAHYYRGTELSRLPD